MIIVKIFGGLGNQLFQYALGRRLALVHQVPLKLDITDFENDSLRQYELHHFNVIESFATPDEVRHVVNASFINRSYRWIQRRILPYSLRSWVKEPSYAYHPAVLTASSRAYLEGYWQSENYFAPIEPIIRREFTFKDPPDAANAALMEQMSTLETVSIHIRRGDYATNPSVNQVHGLLSLDYYHQAIDQLVPRLNQPHFFVFSDDPQWVRDQLQLKFPATYVSHNQGARAYEDLRLMSHCKHHIIANSSFSWWGAWLSSNSEKIVLYPAKWANFDSLNTPDRIPEGWERIG